MQLTYRGIKYDYTPPTVEYSDAPTVGKYRGLDVRFRNPQKLPVLQTNLDLKYRNAAYQYAQPALAITPEVEAVAAVQSVETPAPIDNVQDRARSLMMDHHRAIKRRQQAMLLRLDSEIGVATSEASNYWSRIQGKVHPSFRASYDRSGAAMS